MKAMATVTNKASAISEAHLDEPRELERVVTRLLERYPTAGETVVRDVVATSVHLFDHAKVRKFVPLLVEKLAKNTLDRRAEIEIRERAG
jgi:hypothetical protein